MNLFRFLKRIAAPALLAVGLVALPAQAQKIRVGYWPSGLTLGYGAVLEAGNFFAEQGLQVEYVHFSDVNGPTRAIAANSIDLAFGSPAAGAFALAIEGVPVKIVLATQPANVSFVVREDSPIKSLADLKGKKIGVYSLASGTRQNLLVMLHQAGLKESDVSIVVTGLLNFAPLMQGQVDATAATDTGLAVGLRKGMGEINVMNVSDHLNISSDMFVVREDTLREKKDLLKAFLKGYSDSAAWMIAHPEEAATLAVKRAIDGTQREINRDVIRLRNASAQPSKQGKGRAPQLGSFDLASLQKGADTYRALGMIQRQIKVTDVVDVSLLPGA